MQALKRVDPWWAALTVWGVVNAVNVPQAVGFLSRVYTGSRAINHLLGQVMIALAVPAAVALFAFVRARAGWRQWLGPAVYLAFVALEVVVDYVWPVEFRSPMRYSILAPYLLLFFGAILTDGLTDVPPESAAVACHRGDHRFAAGVDGGCHVHRCGMS